MINVVRLWLQLAIAICLNLIAIIMKYAVCNVSLKAELVCKCSPEFNTLKQLNNLFAGLQDPQRGRINVCCALCFGEGPYPKLGG